MIINSRVEQCLQKEWVSRGTWQVAGGVCVQLSCWRLSLKADIDFRSKSESHRVGVVAVVVNPWVSFVHGLLEIGRSFSQQLNKFDLGEPTHCK